MDRWREARSMTERDVPRALLDLSAELNRKAIGKLLLIDRADEQAGRDGKSINRRRNIN